MLLHETFCTLQQEFGQTTSCPFVRPQFVRRLSNGLEDLLGSNEFPSILREVARVGRTQLQRCLMD